MPDSFWSKVTGTPRPATPEAPASRPWWQDPPAPQQPAAPAASPPWQPAQLTTEAITAQAIAEGHDVSKAQHFQHEANCPSCGSGDYLKPPGGGRARCFDCGYPIVQQGSGLNVSTGGKGTQARQVASAGGIVHNYQPKQIVDRIT